ncbi:MAG: glycosyl hydrolase family 26, partial [Chitinivibrionales bacterium]|nr:glycosyl hydrolase family 26 [Chitinivibrionales bacterium]
PMAHLPTQLTPAAQATLDFISSISGEYVLAGQHNYAPVGNTYSERVAQMTGRTPIMWGSDLSFIVEADTVDGHYHCGPLNVSDPGDPDCRLLDTDVDTARDKVVRTAIEQHRKGHIITLMWHCPFPTFGDKGDYSTVWAFENRPDPETWEALTTPGTALQAQWQAQADRVAVTLARLRDAGVPVLWRPYHEMNGVWFWWCNHPGPHGFKRLWAMMHDRFVRHHRLDNLIWVWNANAPRERPGDEAYEYAEFYPGAERVDILAADVYRNDYRQSHHDELVALADGKPIALGEVGEVPTPQVLRQQPRWAWFMPWGCLVERNENRTKVPLLYDDERVLTLENVERVDSVYRIVES